MIRREYFFQDCKVVVEYKTYNSLKRTEDYIFSDVASKEIDVTPSKNNLENTLNNHFFNRARHLK